MPDTDVFQVNWLGKGQPELLSFADHKGQLIGDQVELPGVDGAENPGPQEIVNAVERDDLASVNEIVAEARASVTGSEIGGSDLAGVEDKTPETVVDLAEVEILV